MIIRAPEGKKYIVSSTNEFIEFGTIIDERGIDYDAFQEGSLNLKKVDKDEALLKIIIKEGLESVVCNFADEKGTEKIEMKSPGEYTYVCKIGSEYSWRARIEEGYNCSKAMGKGEIPEESELIIVKGSIKKFKFNVIMDEHIESCEIKINDNAPEVIKDKSFEKEVSYGDTIWVSPFVEEGFDLEYSPDFIHIFDDYSLTLKAVEVEKDSCIIPVSMDVEGDWAHKARISKFVDISGLKFFVIYSDGSRKEVSDVSYQSNWGDKVGEQECSFIYTYGGLSIAAHKTAYVYPIEIEDRYGNVFLRNSYYELCGIERLVKDKAEIPRELVGITNKVFRGDCGIKHLVVHEAMNVIPGSAFEGNTTLESIEFRCRYPFIIGKRAFYGCSNLKSVDFLSCGDRFKESKIGDGITKDVWEGCDRLSVIKITKGNFSSSLGSVSFTMNENNSNDIYVSAAGPVFKYNLLVSGNSVEDKGVLTGNPLTYEVFSYDNKESFLNRALLYKDIPRTEQTSVNGNVFFYEKGDFLMRYKDSAKIDRWDFNNGIYAAKVSVGEGNKADVSFEVLGLGSEEFDYSKVVSNGYKFRTLGKIGISELGSPEDMDFSIPILKVSDVLYPNINIDNKSGLDFLKPVF